MMKTEEITERNGAEQHSSISEETDWNNAEALKDLVLIILIALLSFILVEALELAQIVSKAAQKYEQSYIGELITVPVILSIAFACYAMRRWKELRDKIHKLRITELKLRDMAAKAKAASIAKSQFLANMSHEIRTPMNAILGFGELLADETLTDQQRDYVDTIHDSGKHLLDLINDILDFSKIEAKQFEMEMVECSLGRILNFIESTMRFMAEEKSLDFKIVEGDNLPERIRTDPTRLRQCLINLINNALKFTEKGHVYLNVSLEYRDDDNQPYIRFDIEDTGIGIPEDKQKQIFGAFVQADGSTNRKYGGTGLGLAITKQLAELLGGELTFTSEVGRGSVFSIAIPAGLDVTKQSSLDIHATHIDPHRVKAEQSGFFGHILVAEDVPTNQMLIKSLLERMGLQVTIVEDGKQVLQKVLTQQFDLILMDIQMPIMNGYEATQELRKQEIKTPIVALTASVMKGDEEKCIEAGCDDYLPKPIDRRELLEKLIKYLPSKTDALSKTVDLAKSKVDKLTNLCLNQASQESGSEQMSCTEVSEEIINWDWLINRAGYEELINEIVPIFLKDSAGRLDKLSETVESNDSGGINFHAHAIKGAARNIGAKRLSDIAHQLECAGKENNVEPTKPLLDKLKVELEKVVAFLSQADWIEVAKQQAEN